MSQQNLNQEITRIVEIALKEDCAFDDITSDLTIAAGNEIAFEINARQHLIFCGASIISEVFLQLKKVPKFKKAKLNYKINVNDGQALSPGKSIADGIGDAHLIFAAERVILNLIQHLSGVATLTQKFIVALDDKKIKILDTRKTIPGLRSLEKYAVVSGGGKNHRLNLGDMILIKDNHIAAAGSVAKAVAAAKKNQRKLKIEVECDTVTQVVEAVAAHPDIIMLDNMNISDIKKSIAAISKKAQIEISGGVNLKNIKKFSGLKIDFISVGSLTHSAPAVDIGLDIV